MAGIESITDPAKIAVGAAVEFSRNDEMETIGKAEKVD